MVTLANLQGSSLSPNIAGAIGSGLDIQGKIQQQKLLGQQAEAQQAKQSQFQELMRQVLGRQPAQQGGLIPGSTPPIMPTPIMQEGDRSQALSRMAVLFPDEFEKINANLGLITDQQKEEAADFSFRLKSVPFERRNEAIQQRITELESQGRDTTQTKELVGLDQEAQDQALDIVQISALSPEKRIELTQGETPTSLQRNLIAAGLQPGTPEFQRAVLESITKPSTSITVGGKAESKEREEIAKVRSRQFERLLTDAESAESTIQSLNQLDAIDVDTGALEPAKASMAAVVEGLGFDASGIADVDTAQAFNAASNRLVNNVLNQAKGPQTEGDAQRARSTIANLGDSPLAAQFKTDSLRAVALRTVEQRDFIEQRVDDGATFSKARREWNTFKRDTPSLSDSVKNPATGLPLYFYQFKDIATKRRPGISEEEIIEAWRQANAEK